MRGLKPVVNEEKKKGEWVEDVRQLIASIKKWAERRRWLVDVHEKKVREEPYGSYVVPELFIRTPQLQKLVIDPVGLGVIGADGRVDIEAFPSLHRFVLVRQDRQWTLLTDSMVEWPEKWGEPAFLGIVEALGKAA
jgi:hypothetical protein